MSLSTNEYDSLINSFQKELDTKQALLLKTKGQERQKLKDSIRNIKKEIANLLLKRKDAIQSQKKEKFPKVNENTPWKTVSVSDSGIFICSSLNPRHWNHGPVL